MESKALSSPARNPRRNGQFSSKMAALWPRGRLHESRYRNESAKPELPLFQQSDSRFRPFHLPESKTSAVGRHQGSFRISYTQFLFVSCISMSADWDQGMKVRDSQNQSQENFKGSQIKNMCAGRKQEGWLLISRLKQQRLRDNWITFLEGKRKHILPNQVSIFSKKYLQKWG